jgi:hypothetical protein
MLPKLSLCIPTIDRWNFLQNNIPKYLKNKYIDEIVICDENGNDAIKIKETFLDDKIKIYVNESKLGVYRNKENVVSKATNEYVCLMDSDNFAPIEYFEAWEKYVNINGINSSTIYSPSRTIPQKNHNGFDYRILNNTIINSENYKKVYKINDVIFNTGNYICNKQFYIQNTTSDNEKHLQVECYALDVLFKNYLMISRGNGKIAVIPDMEYHHIVHPGSIYTNTISKIDVKYFYSLYN